MTKKEKLCLEEIDKVLINFADSDNLYKKNPYSRNLLEESISGFIKAVKDDDKSFSWLDKFSLEKKSDKANVNYGLPSHVHGDYKNASLYLCLKNPGMQIDDDKEVDGIQDYYNTIAKEASAVINGNTSDSKYTTYEEMDEKIIKYSKNYDKLKENDEKTINYIKEYIYSDKISILTKELVKIKNLKKELIYKDEEDRDGKYSQEEWDKLKWTDLKQKDLISKNCYYIWTYFKDILDERFVTIENTLDYFDIAETKDIYLENNEKAQKLSSNKIINLELIPFRSKKSDVVNDTLDSKYSKFSAYIILYRIGKFFKDYKNNEDEEKPIFIFRAYKEWIDLLEKCIKDLLCEYFKNKAINNKLKDTNISMYMDKLKKEFFLTFSAQSARISENNLRKPILSEDYKNISDLL